MKPYDLQSFNSAFVILIERGVNIVSILVIIVYEGYNKHRHRHRHRHRLVKAWTVLPRCVNSSASSLLAAVTTTELCWGREYSTDDTNSIW